MSPSLLIAFQDRSFTLPQLLQLHHCLSTTLPQREHSQNAGPLGAGGGLLLEPLVLFLNETILECIRSELDTGRAGRVVALGVGVGRGRWAALSLSSCSASCLVTFSGLTVWQASQVRKLGGLCRVQISHVHPLADGGVRSSSGSHLETGLGLDSDLGTAADGFEPVASARGLGTLAEAFPGPGSDLGTVEGPPGRDHSGTGGGGLVLENAPPPLPVGKAAVGAT